MSGSTHLYAGRMALLLGIIAVKFIINFAMHTLFILFSLHSRAILCFPSRANTAAASNGRSVPSLECAPLAEPLRALVPLSLWVMQMRTQVRAEYLENPPDGFKPTPRRVLQGVSAVPASSITPRRWRCSRRAPFNLSSDSRDSENPWAIVPVYFRGQTDWSLSESPEDGRSVKRG